MRKISVKRCVIAEIGIFMIAVGVSFNAMAQLGNDPVGIFYDGIRNALSLSQTQLGIASNLINIIFFGLLCLFGRKYIHIGTSELQLIRTFLRRELWHAELQEA